MRVSSNNTEKKRVLVVSDSPLTLAELKMELMDYFDVLIASASDSALHALEMYEVSIIVIHIGEHRETPFAVCADISETAKKENIPIMFIADKGKDTDETQAFESGAVDYAVRRKGAVNALITRMTLRICASENEKLSIGNDCSLASHKNAAESALYGKTILVAEDMELNREIIGGMLHDIEGLVLEFAEDGKDAVERFAKEPTRYSLILMDIQMPVMNGIEATKAIRSLSSENARDVPIVALTASDEEGVTEKYLSAGMNDYIKKPMAYDQLIALITAYCS